MSTVLMVLAAWALLSVPVGLFAARLIGGPR